MVKIERFVSSETRERVIDRDEVIEGVDAREVFCASWETKPSRRLTSSRSSVEQLLAL
jgi:hypothetical protein